MKSIQYCFGNHRQDRCINCSTNHSITLQKNMEL